MSVCVSKEQAEQSMIEAARLLELATQEDSPAKQVQLALVAKEQLLEVINHQKSVSAINLNSRNFAKVFGNARKRTSIRLGDKPHTIGNAVLMCDGKPSPEVVEISEVRKVCFGSLGLEDAVLHGYNSIDELKAELAACYQQPINNSDIVTIVRFEIEGD